MSRHSDRDALWPIIISGLAGVMLIFASTEPAQTGASTGKKGIIGEEGVKPKGIIGEEGVKQAGQAFEIVKAPDGSYYRLTPAQLKGLAKESDPDKPPCKPKDCLLISAYGQKLSVTVMSLSKYKIPAGAANDQINAGIQPLPAQYVK